jgi:hypothetical protein
MLHDEGIDLSDMSDWRVPMPGPAGARLRRGRAPGRLVRLVAGFAVSVTVLVAGAAGVGVGPALAEDDGLRFESRSVYRLDPASDVVNVTVELTVTHEVPDPSDGSFYYFDGVSLAVPAEAANVSAVGDGGPAAVMLEPSDLPTWRHATIEVTPVLRFRQTRSYTLTFTLPGLAPRSEGLTRINDAVAAFLAVAHGDPGLASVEVVLPSTLDTDVVGADVEARVDGDVRVYTAAGIADPDTWAASVLARDEEALVDNRIEAAGHAIDVRAWPGDTAWSEFVTQQAQTGIPALEELIGLPWPAPADGLDVVESVTPLAHGFGGWYDSSRNTIEIGDELDPHLVLHELSHLWFNGTLFDQRWILEGLAEDYASRALATVGGAAPGPEVLGPDHPGALPLNAWTASEGVRDEVTVQRELFAYATAWSVVRRLNDEIGTEAMAAVLATAADDLIAYQGDAPPEGFTGPADWRRLLDLLEEVGGSTTASDVFATVVATPEQQPSITDRRSARAVYDGLEVAGGDWTPPLAVRQAMAAWDFASALALAETASAVLGVRDQITASVEPLGVEAPEPLESAYESASGDATDLDDVASLADETLDAAGELVSADQLADADRGVLATIGLWGRDVDAELRTAVAEFENGDPAAATEHADRVEQLLDGARGAGRLRAAAAAAVLLIGVALVVLLLVTARRRPA